MSSTGEDVIRRRHVQQDSACSFSVRQDSDISTQGTAPVYVIDMSRHQSHVSNWRCDKTQTCATSVCGLESESRMKQDCVFCLMS
jgi:hypothetical protein